MECLVAELALMQSYLQVDGFDVGPQSRTLGEGFPTGIAWEVSQAKVYGLHVNIKVCTVFEELAASLTFVLGNCDVDSLDMSS